MLFFQLGNSSIERIVKTKVDYNDKANYSFFKISYYPGEKLELLEWIVKRKL